MGKGHRQLAGGSSMTYKREKKNVLNLKKVFDSIDVDGSGQVSLPELLMHYKKEGYNLDGKAFKSIDKDGDGDVTFKEFLLVQYPRANAHEITMMLAWTKPQEEEEEEEEVISPEQMSEFKAMFNLYDANKNGTLEKCELVEALTSAGYDSDEVEDVIEDWDEDGNGEFSLEEFIQMLKPSK